MRTNPWAGSRQGRRTDPGLARGAADTRSSRRSVLAAAAGAAAWLSATRRPARADQRSDGTPDGGTEAAAATHRIISVPARSPGTGNQFYFVVTDRFANGDPRNDAGGLDGDRWTTGFDPTDANMFHGGDFAGLQRRLRYIAGLGTTALWVTPPMKGDNVMRFGDVGIANYHGYWTLDLTTIDPHLGTEHDVKTFIAAAHRAGIKVYFDIEINTTADVISYADGDYDYIPIDQRPWTDSDGNRIDLAAIAGQPHFPRLDPATSFPHRPVIAEDSRHLKRPEWLNDPTLYHNRGNTTYTGESVTYGDLAGLDDLMTEHPRVVRGMIDVYKRWIDFGVDGFRVDTVKHVNFEFWRAWTRAVMDHAHRRGKRDFFMFGEVLDGDPTHLAPYLRETSMGGLLDFPFAGHAQDFAKGGSAADLSSFFATDDLYTTTASSAHDLETFVSNHDLGRIGQALGDSDHALQRDLLAQALMLLSRGQPVVYYGDEQGFTGGPSDLATDVAGRQDMFATKVAAYAKQQLVDGRPFGTLSHFATRGKLYRAIADLGRLRAHSAALRTGAQIELHAASSAGIYAFSRVDRSEKIENLVALNNATTTQRITLNTLTSNCRYRVRYGPAGHGSTSDAAGRLKLRMAPLTVVILTAEHRVDAPGTAQHTAITEPEPGSTVDGMAAITVRNAAHTWQETSFGWRIAGSGRWHPLGATDTSRPFPGTDEEASDPGAQQRIYHDVADLKPGTRLEYRAVTVDAAGHHSTASTSATVKR